jgi:crotonobetainyl-CoA:carnitine CoA-transferase CaiB-like acyl-CoA transferase
VATWTAARTREQVVATLRPAGVPVAPVAEQRERIELDAETQRWGLWPTVPHSRQGDVRVDGVPAHLSLTDWHLRRGGPLLGEDNDTVLGGLLGLSTADIDQLRADGVI